MNTFLPTNILCHLLMLIVTCVRASKDEHRLLTDLMRTYDARVRPVANISQPVVVTMGVILQALVDVDEKNERVTFNAWLQYNWLDSSLQWEPKEYDNIFDLRFPCTALWKPDVLLYNSVAAEFDVTYPSNLIVYSSGDVSWIPPGIFLIGCKIDITWFPFDEQLCFFKFGSWTYDGTKLDLQTSSDTADLSDYVVSGEWDIYQTKAIRSEKYYDCCPEPYPSLKYEFYLKRRTLYFGVNLIVPCLVLTLMTIFGFMLPCDGCQKVTLQITIMLAICFFLDIVAKMSPPTSEAVPLLGVFFCTCFFLCAASLVLTVAVLNVHYRCPDFYEMSPFANALLLQWLPWLMTMSRPGKPIKRRQLPLPNVYKLLYKNLFGFVRKNGDNKDDTDCTIDEHELSEVDHRINQCYKQLAAQQHSLNTFMQNALVLMHMSYTNVKKISKRMKEEDIASEQNMDWVFAAMAIDRLCMWLLTLFICGSTCFIFFSAPYLVVPLE